MDARNCSHDGSKETSNATDEDAEVDEVAVERIAPEVYGQEVGFRVTPPDAVGNSGDRITVAALVDDRKVTLKLTDEEARALGEQLVEAAEGEG